MLAGGNKTKLDLRKYGEVEIKAVQQGYLPPVAGTDL
jgi:hypothetical protein